MSQSRLPLIAMLSITASACANNPRVSYDVRPLGGEQYALTIRTQDFDKAQHGRELLRRATATCGGAYSLAEEDFEEIVTVCTDDCEGSNYITTTATLSCGKASG